jgi:hypothetical protein
MNKALLEAMRDHLEDGQLPCAQAHRIAQQFDLDPLQVGQAANEADIRINRCQLGLFGYGPKSLGKHKIVNPMDDVPEGLAARLRAAGDGQGITCAAIWQIADELGYLRLEASSAVETMGLRVSHCQLGCFPRP